MNALNDYFLYLELIFQIVCWWYVISYFIQSIKQEVNDKTSEPTGNQNYNDC
jgi:hypothetical protein